MADVANLLFYGDNLDVLRDLDSGLVDLIYLDPPFNSNRSYNVLFKGKTGDDAQAQIQAFDDSWTWSQQSEAVYLDLVTGGGVASRVADAIEAMRRLLGDNDMLAYLVMMTARLAEMRRVLKPTGSLYLHCDPTASHYLKIILDAVFGPENFRNEVIWKRTGAHGRARKWGPIHDSILFYTRSPEYTWNRVFEDYDESYVENFYRFEDEHGRYRLVTLDGPGIRQGSSGQPWRGVDPTEVGRHWEVPPDRALPSSFKHPVGYADMSVQERLDLLDAAGLIYWPKKGRKPQHKRYLDAAAGNPIQDVIADVRPISSQAAERLGYPTQKPLALLERIIGASTNPGEIVLDPFCGCGTTIDAAQKLGRRWIGVDVTYLAVDLIRKRLRHTYGDEIDQTYGLRGIPVDAEGAQALFEANPFDFERWAVSLVNGQPNEKQVGDKGIDGVIRFGTDAKGGVGRVIVSVKGGKTVPPTFMRDLIGTVGSQRAEMGLLICMARPTAGMTDAANHSGTYQHPVSGQKYPKVQVITVEALLAGKGPNMPTAMLPYVKAKPYAGEQLSLG